MTKSELDHICQGLGDLQRKRTVFIKSRIMLENRLTAIIAIRCFNYTPKHTEDEAEKKERKKKFKQAWELIKHVYKTEEDHPYATIINAHMASIAPLNKAALEIEHAMKDLVRDLPVWSWTGEPEQRGFGELNLAIIVGECGNLDNYPTQWKLMKRLGCAPYTYDGKTQMGSTWRGVKRFKCGSLPPDEWCKFNYSPIRRSIAYNVGHPLMMLNEEGPYRKRYEQAKKRMCEAHPEYTAMRCERHGQLCCTKLLLENLWKEWRRRKVER